MGIELATGIFRESPGFRGTTGDRNWRDGAWTSVEERHRAEDGVRGVSGQVKVRVPRKGPTIPRSRRLAVRSISQCQP